MPAQHLWLLVTGVQEVHGALQDVWRFPSSELPGSPSWTFLPAFSNEAATVQLGLGRR